ncbi:MAG: amino acid ABC transporter permease [Clostridia bacterium]|nr:amino acid ABC transporter permease [Clostridia bacterium]
MEWLNKWFDRLYRTFIVDDRYKTLISGLEKTLIITLGALLIGVIIGTIIAIIKVFAADNKKLRPLDVLCNIYLTVIRGTPVVVQLLISFFIIFVWAKDGTWVATVTFGINSGAYVAEVIRSGIMAIDAGQMEAGRSLGLSKIQTMKEIILPQAFKNVLPAIGNEMIALLKETSVAGYVAVTDLTKAANQIKNTTYDSINPILLTAIVYLAIVMLLTKLLSIMERRLRKSDKS